MQIPGPDQRAGPGQLALEQHAVPMTSARAFFSGTGGKLVTARDGRQQAVRAGRDLRSPENDAVLVVVCKSIDEIPDAVVGRPQRVRARRPGRAAADVLLAIPLAATLVRRLQRLRRRRCGSRSRARRRAEVPGRSGPRRGRRPRAVVLRSCSAGCGNRRRRGARSSRPRRTSCARRSRRSTACSSCSPRTSRSEQPDMRGRAGAARPRAGAVAAARPARRRPARSQPDRRRGGAALRAGRARRAEPGRARRVRARAAQSAASARRLRDGAGPVWALGDPGSVARILRILLDNALRVAPRGSEIVVALGGRSPRRR